MTAILRTRNLTKLFPGVIANRDVNFDLRLGELHCLFGENGAGKSTLTSCLFGHYPPDGGEIEIDGKSVAFKSPRDAIAHGIGMVHQHFILVDEFSVLDNIIVGTQKSGWRLERGAAIAKIEHIAASYGIEIDLQARLGDLAVGQQQWVEILKALYLDVRVLILDEPSAVLTPAESVKLFEIINAMRAKGIAVLLISHKMEEVMQADRVTVLRKGEVVATLDPKNSSPQELTRLMVGRDIDLRVTHEKLQKLEKAPIVLSARNVDCLNDRGQPALRNVSLDLHEGEILGLAGVSGNGQKELFELLSGNRNLVAGEIELEGETLTNASARDYMEKGVGLIPDDRFREGLVGDFSVAENMVLGWQRDSAYRRGPFMHKGKMRQFARDMIEKFQIKAPSADAPVGKLSGGNAQKVILAREFTHAHKLILANQPTRGLDLGVIEYVYKQLIAKRDAGYGILLASEELEDLMNLCDRIAVICDGRITGIVEPSTTSIPEIGLLMAGGN